MKEKTRKINLKMKDIKKPNHLDRWIFKWILFWKDNERIKVW